MSRNLTTMGGIREVFDTTSWTMIEGVGERKKVEQEFIINHLIGRYWKPVYCYLRRKGLGNESAKDLTQDFFQEVVLGRDLIQQASRHKGRFRTFLLTALDHYTIDMQRRKCAQKHMPQGQRSISYLRDFASELQENSVMTPDQAFSYAWATDLLDDVLAAVESDCHRTGKILHWKVFKARVLTPIMENTSAPSLKDICRQCQVQGESKASNMVITVKRKFRRQLETCIRLHVDKETEVEHELEELLNILSRSFAGN